MLWMHGARACIKLQIMFNKVCCWNLAHTSTQDTKFMQNRPISIHTYSRTYSNNQTFRWLFCFVLEDPKKMPMERTYYVTWKHEKVFIKNESVKIIKMLFQIFINNLLFWFKSNFVYYYFEIWESFYFSNLILFL